jgi:hypothetical protein
MLIGLDFDNTYTRDPEAWNTFIRYFTGRGHTVYCTTFRYPEQSEQVYQTIGEIIGRDRCYFTSYTAKHPFMLAQGIYIDVWIDDMPMLIYQGVDTGHEP